MTAVWPVKQIKNIKLAYTHTNTHTLRIRIIFVNLTMAAPKHRGNVGLRPMHKTKDTHI